MWANCFSLLRLIAAVQVMLVHIGDHFEVDSVFITALKIFPGVPIFFFMSGIMIYGACERSEGAWLKFFLNRFLRIFPALWVCVILSTCSVYFLGYTPILKEGTGSVVTWLLAQMSIVQFYNPDFMRAYGTGVLNGALWTISVELQFYFLAPIIYFILKKEKKGLLFLIFGISALLNFVSLYGMDTAGIVSRALRITFLPWIFIFILGCMVSHYKNFAKRILDFSYPLTLILFVGSMFFLGTYKRNASNSINFVAILLLCVLVYKLGHEKKLINNGIRRLTDKIDLSYGMYLFHIPIINAFLWAKAFSLTTNIIMTISLTFIIAVASWFLVEKPALNLKKKFF